MSRRLPILVILIVILGCHSAPLAVPTPDEPVRTSTQIDVKKAPPASLQAIASATPPSPPPETPADHLAEASRCIERDDLRSAGDQLSIYLNAKPDALAVRVQYAEILVSLQRPEEARGQFNLFLASAQEQKAEGSPTIIHVYRRLMEIAEESRDEYGLHLYRGIGLFLLAQRGVQLGARDEEMPVESLLCKAAAELKQAHEERPQEAQASWYLYQVWSRLGQRHPALAHLREAHDAAPFSYLSPLESRRLSMACLELLSERTTH